MIRRQQILHVARLARLALSPGEETRLAAQVEEILEYVDRLREIDGEVIGDLTDGAPVESPARADETRPGLPREEVLALAPRSDGETMHVPAVLEGGGEA